MFLLQVVKKNVSNRPVRPYIQLYDFQHLGCLGVCFCEWAPPLPERVDRGLAGEEGGEGEGEREVEMSTSSESTEASDGALELGDSGGSSVVSEYVSVSPGEAGGVWEFVEALVGVAAVGG